MADCCNNGNWEIFCKSQNACTQGCLRNLGQCTYTCQACEEEKAIATTIIIIIVCLVLAAVIGIIYCCCYKPYSLIDGKNDEGKNKNSYSPLLSSE